MSDSTPPAQISSEKKPKSRKRKAPHQEPQEPRDPKSEPSSPAPLPAALPTTTTTTTATTTRKPKQKKRRKATDDDDDALLDLDLGVNTAIARLDPDLLADHAAAKTKRFGTDLSAIELSDLYVPAGAIRDTTAFAAPRVKENLPDFLEEFAGSEQEKKWLGSAPTRKGAPHTIVVAGAGLRAADLVRAARKFQKKDNVVAKLFAKHFKLEEQVQFLQKSRTGIAIGTPARLNDLMDHGALSIASLKRIVIDASHIDQKKRGVMDMKETMMPLAKWLTRKEFKERYSDPKKPLDLMFF